jgi:hypothetical protein
MTLAERLDQFDLAGQMIRVVYRNSLFRAARIRRP